MDLSEQYQKKTDKEHILHNPDLEEEQSYIYLQSLEDESCLL